MGLGKGVFMGDILGWPSTSVWGRMACMLDACRWLHGFSGDALKTPAILMSLFEELCRVYCSRE